MYIYIYINYICVFYHMSISLVLLEKIWRVLSNEHDKICPFEGWQ